MKTAVTNIRPYFEPLLGTRPWRAKLGVGSFLTFEFGRRIKANGHVHGERHLWIYLSNWVLFHGNRRLADSDSDRRVISVSIRRLEESPLTGILFEGEGFKTTFIFEDFRLEVSPADYLDAPDEQDDYWLFFMPNNEVLTVGVAGVRVGRSDTNPAMEAVSVSARKSRD